MDYFPDTDISPFTQYQYQVIAENKAGKAPSQWSLPVRSNEAPPDSVPTPELSDIRSRSVRVDCGAPETANGVIRFYHVHIKEVNASELLEKVNILLGSMHGVKIEIHSEDKLISSSSMKRFKQTEFHDKTKFIMIRNNITEQRHCLSS